MGERFYYNEFGTYLRERFGGKVQKITIDGGFTCPNRDGTKGRGGCTYCNNRTFNPAFCHKHLPVAEQMREGIAFFSHKYPSMRYLAYFQAYTNTYDSLDNLKRRYEEALAVEGCVGVVSSDFCVSNILPLRSATVLSVHCNSISFTNECEVVYLASECTVHKVTSKRDIERSVRVSYARCGHSAKAGTKRVDMI